MAAELLWLALVALLAPVLTEYGKIKAQIEKQLAFVAGGGLLFLLAAGFETPVWTGGQLAAYGPYGSALFQILGWILLLVGTLWGAYALMKK